MPACRRPIPSEPKQLTRHDASVCAPRDHASSPQALRHSPPPSRDAERHAALRHFADRQRALRGRQCKQARPNSTSLVCELHHIIGQPSYTPITLACTGGSCGWGQKNVQGNRSHAQAKVCPSDDRRAPALRDGEAHLSTIGRRQRGLRQQEHAHLCNGMSSPDLSRFSGNDYGHGAIDPPGNHP